MEYNTSRESLILPEYGRHIHNMVGHVAKIEDRAERNKAAEALIGLMGQLNPHLRDVPEFNYKLWEHLFIISDFKLDIDSPYPKPEKGSLKKEPRKLQYNQGRLKFRYYGHVILNFIKKASEMPEGEERDALVVEIGNMMKKSFLLWNRETVDDELIRQHLTELSDGKLSLDAEEDLIATNSVVSSKSNNRRGKKKNYKRNKRR